MSNLYEIGTVFSAREGAAQPKERRKLPAFWLEPWAPAAWNNAPAAFDFFDGKACLSPSPANWPCQVCFKGSFCRRLPHLRSPAGAAQMLRRRRGRLGWRDSSSRGRCLRGCSARCCIRVGHGCARALRVLARDYVDVPQFPLQSRVTPRSWWTNLSPTRSSCRVHDIGRR